MEAKNLIEGQTYRITGNKSGCSDKKCKNCKHYPKHIVQFEDLNMNYENGRFAHCYLVPKKNSHCYFNPKDLVPLTWKNIYETQQIP